MGTWGTILLILCSRGTPNGHIEAQMSVFIDFREPTLGTPGRPRKVEVNFMKKSPGRISGGGVRLLGGLCVGRS